MKEQPAVYKVDKKNVHDEVKSWEEFARSGMIDVINKDLKQHGWRLEEFVKPNEVLPVRLKDC